MASRALEADYSPARTSEWADPAFLESSGQSRPGYGTVSLASLVVPVALSETGEQIRVVVKPDRRGVEAALAPIRPALQVINEAASYGPGWDSYSARPIDRRAVRPTVELLLAGSRRCAVPRIVPTPEGGFELHWLNGDDELEVTVNSDGLVEFVWFSEGPEGTGDHEGTGMSEALKAISRFCSLRR